MSKSIRGDDRRQGCARSDAPQEDSVSAPEAQAAGFSLEHLRAAACRSTESRTIQLIAGNGATANGARLFAAQGRIGIPRWSLTD